MRAAATGWTDRRGAVVLEFALLLPVMLTLLLGGTALLNALACSRKVTITARAVADLVAQDMTGTVTASEVDSDLGAASAILLPFSAANAIVRVSEITTDSSGNTTVVWSRAMNGQPYGAGSAIVVPSSMRTAGVYYIYSEIKYQYGGGSIFGVLLPSSLNETVYMVPRNVAQIACSNC